MSLQSTYPQFYEVEKKHRSLILRYEEDDAETGTAKRRSWRFPKGAFHSLRNGLESIVEAAEQQLEPGTVRKGIRIAKHFQAGESNRSRVEYG